MGLGPLFKSPTPIINNIAKGTIRRAIPDEPFAVLNLDIVRIDREGRSNGRTMLGNRWRRRFFVCFLGFCGHRSSVMRAQICARFNNEPEAIKVARLFY